jgi:hypothetical protein
MLITRDGGGLLGALGHNSLRLDKADRERIGREPRAKAAVGVLAPVSEADFVAGKLTELGGTAEAHEVSDKALEEAHPAAAARFCQVLLPRPAHPASRRRGQACRGRPTSVAGRAGSPLP